MHGSVLPSHDSQITAHSWSSVSTQQRSKAPRGVAVGLCERGCVAHVVLIVTKTLARLVVAGPCSHINLAGAWREAVLRWAAHAGVACTLSEGAFPLFRTPSRLLSAIWSSKT